MRWWRGPLLHHHLGGHHRLLLLASIPRSSSVIYLGARMLIALLIGSLRGPFPCASASVPIWHRSRLKGAGKNMNY